MGRYFKKINDPLEATRRVDIVFGFLAAASLSTVAIYFY